MKKARVRATREIVFVEANLGYPGGYVASNGNTYLGEELEVIVDCDPDYWTRLEHTYAGMAMQGILSNSNITYKDISNETLCGHWAENAKLIAHALVEKLKESK